MVMVVPSTVRETQFGGRHVVGTGLRQGSSDQWELEGREGSHRQKGRRESWEF